MRAPVYLPEDEYGHELDQYECPGCGQCRELDETRTMWLESPVGQYICDDCDNPLDRLHILGEALAEAAKSEGADARTIAMDVLAHLSEELDVL